MTVLIMNNPSPDIYCRSWRNIRSYQLKKVYLHSFYRLKNKHDDYPEWWAFPTSQRNYDRFWKQLRRLLSSISNLPSHQLISSIIRFFVRKLSRWDLIIPDSILMTFRIFNELAQRMQLIWEPEFCSTKQIYVFEILSTPPFSKKNTFMATK